MSSKVLENVIKQLKEVPGVVDVIVLARDNIEAIYALEEEAEKKIMMGFAKGLNLGVREALKRSHVLAAITDMNFNWGDKPVVKMVIGEEVVGEEVRDSRLLEEYRRRGNLVLGNFVIYRDKVKSIRERGKECCVLLLPLELSKPVRVENVINVVVGSPSPPADLFIKRLFNNPEFFKAGYGTIVVGFDVLKP